MKLVALSEMFEKRRVYSFLCFHVIYFFNYLNIDAQNVLLNHALDAHTRVTSVRNVTRVSYTQCLTHFKCNTQHANVMVYKRRFSLCSMYNVSEELVYRHEPGSVLAHTTLIGKFGTIHVYMYNKKKVMFCLIISTIILVALFYLTLFIIEI
jgi:hypothetical protein